jgi:hypothetical protein
MPKQPKTKAKSKAKLKKQQKTQPEVPSITTKKSYWVMLTVLMAVVVSVAGVMVNLEALQVVVLAVTVVLLIGLLGYVRVTPSSLPKFKRAVFLTFGASIIGFSIWAIFMLILNYTGVIAQLENTSGTTFYVIPSLIICIIGGAFIGELLGKISRIEKFIFRPRDAF